jgi:hypothetical protein
MCIYICKYTGLAAYGATHLNRKSFDGRVLAEDRSKRSLSQKKHTRLFKIYYLEKHIKIYYLPCDGVIPVE